MMLKFFLLSIESILSYAFLFFTDEAGEQEGDSVRNRTDVLERARACAYRLRLRLRLRLP